MFELGHPGPDMGTHEHKMVPLRSGMAPRTEIGLN